MRAVHLLFGSLALFGASVTSSAFAAVTDSDALRHLLSRTAFAARPAEIDALAGLGYERAVRRLIENAGSEAVTAPPAWAKDWRPSGTRPRDMTEQELQTNRKKRREQALELKGWWYREMIASPTPLTEVMTLFWHGHFTSGLRKVKAPALLLRQNLLLRREALGNFGTLLHAITRDPAMLLYLDGARSQRRAPNENFARELFELFTLGEGHYSERDVKEAARAFTGFSLERSTGDFRFRPRWHDDGVKTVLGRSGRFDGDDIVDILLAHPRTAEQIVEKLWRAFIGDEPDRAEVLQLAADFRGSNYEIKPLLQAIFLSPAFRSPAARGALIKSPVELLVGTVRLFEIPIRDGRNLARAGRRLGQDLFEPPNVKGWPGGTAWITGDSLIERQALLSFMTGEAGAMAVKANAGGKQPKRMARQLAGNLDRWLDRLPPAWQGAQGVAWLLAPLPPVDAPLLDRDASDALVRQLLLDPVYQLK